MDPTVIVGDGRLGRSIEAAIVARGDPSPRVLGRPRAGRHTAADFVGASVVVDASAGPAVRHNVEAALGAGCRRLVLAPSGWDDDREALELMVRLAAATAVIAPNLSLGAAIFLRLVDRAAALVAPVGGFDPYVVEWHRRGKTDRPSGTAREIVRRLRQAGVGEATLDQDVAVVRAGGSPGMHLVGFDSLGETIELRLTARDRSAYAAGALAAIDWLIGEPRHPGLHAFDAVVDDLLPRLSAAATA